MNSNKNKNQISQTRANIETAKKIINDSKLFTGLNNFNYNVILQKKEVIGKEIKAYVNAKRIQGLVRGYKIYVNENILLTPKEWAFVIVHCYMHLVFGHFDMDKVPGYIKTNIDGTKEKIPSFDKGLWNKACDIYVNRFLADIKFGERLINSFEEDVPANLHDEISIYNYLKETGADYKQSYGVADIEHLDMLGLDDPIVYDGNGIHYNAFARSFISAISDSASEVIADISDNSYKEKDNKFDMKTTWGKAAAWFLNKYPLLGGLAASFKIIDDKKIANMYDISVAAIDVDTQEIIINPVAYDDIEHWKFVLAHEYLHAGLCHNERCQGRNQFLWNVACDYVINSWLKEMQVGEMPQDGLLYDEKLKNMSAEEIYDELVKNLKKNLDLKTFRGIGNGDMISTASPTFSKGYGKGVSLDDFCKKALMEGLEYHLGNNRGFLPAGLVEEIRALAMPPVPWDVELARWFDIHFAPIEKHRTYARPSRRQASTPNIPRPSYAPFDFNDKSRTFGVVVDTSGSMSAKEIGMALGSIASYASAKDVYAARVVFCDANAYDAGYMTPDDIAGRVKVKGRGGTVLQPAIDLLEKAEDFPKDGSILIITDGEIEDHMSIKRDHAFLLPRGKRLPFKAKGDIFYFQEK